MGKNYLKKLSRKLSQFGTPPPPPPSILSSTPSHSSAAEKVSRESLPARKNVQAKLRSSGEVEWLCWGAARGWRGVVSVCSHWPNSTSLRLSPSVVTSWPDVTPRPGPGRADVAPSDRHIESSVHRELEKAKLSWGEIPIFSGSPPKNPRMFKMFLFLDSVSLLDSKPISIC